MFLFLTRCENCFKMQEIDKVFVSLCKFLFSLICVQKNLFINMCAKVVLLIYFVVCFFFYHLLCFTLNYSSILTVKINLKEEKNYEKMKQMASNI